MTSAVLKDGSPLSSSAEPHSPTDPLPQTESSSTPAVDGEDGAAGQQHADTGVQSPVLEEQQQSSVEKRPWWKTRKAMLAFAGGAVLLILFVVLLTLGLLGYLKKVGPFANLFNKQSTEIPANPLSTIPLMADPFATQTAVPTATPTLMTLAGVPTPTNQPTLQAVRYHKTLHLLILTAQLHWDESMGALKSHMCFIGLQDAFRRICAGHTRIILISHLHCCETVATRARSHSYLPT